MPDSAGQIVREARIKYKSRQLRRTFSSSSHSCSRMKPQTECRFTVGHLIGGIFLAAFRMTLKIVLRVARKDQDYTSETIFFILIFWLLSSSHITVFRMVAIYLGIAREKILESSPLRLIRLFKCRRRHYATLNQRLQITASDVIWTIRTYDK